MDINTKNHFDSVIKKFLGDWFLDDKYDYLYLLLFNKPCKRWGVLISKEGKFEIKPILEDVDLDYDKYNFIDYNAFLKWINEWCDYKREYMNSEGKYAILYIYKTTLIYVYSTSKYVKEILVYDSDEPRWMEGVLKISKEKQELEDAEFTYITQDRNGYFNSNILKIKHNLNVSLDNYNDDLPYDRMKDFCKADESGLMLFSGPAGTGKTTLIKKLIHDTRVQFILLSAETLMHIDTSSFMQYLIKKGTNAVLVLEDCDTLLSSRDTTNNNAISVLLNLSDGILGDALNLKFICTYNTDDSKIDSALLRKGRLKLKYIFKELSKEKVHKLNPKLNKAMTLADLYNQEENDINSKKSKPIGFNISK